MTTWESIYQLAKEAGAKFPECVAAQWALESGWGKHTSGNNNYFGLKGVPGAVVKTKEFINGQWITINDSFKHYNSVTECVKDLVKKWYKDYAGFDGVNRASTREECAKLLVLEGYATDPKYATKLIELMNKQSPQAAEESFLERAAKYYTGQPWQRGALRALEAKLSKDTLEEFQAAYRGTVKPMENNLFPLNVPYFYQRDSKTGHGERMCFSSSMAMALDYLDPHAIGGDDDWYLQHVFKYGDSVSSDAQVKAAQSLGFKVRFRTNGSQKDLEALLDKGIPVPIGILHKGSVSKPSGGGHWICLIGHDKDNFVVHDPFGELDLVNGGYPKAGPRDGMSRLYSKKNLMRRWLINGTNDGWYMELGAI